MKKFIVKQMKALGISQNELAVMTHYSRSHIARTLMRKKGSRRCLEAMYDALMTERNIYECTENK